jgi:hypothetical protein
METRVERSGVTSLEGTKGDAHHRRPWDLLTNDDQLLADYRALKVTRDKVVEEIRGRPGASEIRSSYVEGANGPGGFSRAYGFVETGEVEHGEVVIRLPL